MTEAASFAPEHLADIPALPSAMPYTPATATGMTEVRSFGVRDTTPEGVLEFYEATLVHAAVATAREQTGPQAFREAWTLANGSTLTVSSIGGVEAPPGASPRSDYDVQYSLRLDRG